MNEFRAKLLEIAYCELGRKDPARYWLGANGALPDKPRAWCGVFYLWCLREADLCNWLWHGLFFSRKLLTTTDPQPGDLAYFDQPYQHHAMVQSVDGDTLKLIQGNYGVPGHVAESECSIAKKKPVFYSIQRLVDNLAARANSGGNESIPEAHNDG